MDLETKYTYINFSYSYLDNSIEEILKISECDLRQYIIILPNYFLCEIFKVKILDIASKNYNKNQLFLPEIYSSDQFIIKFDKTIKTEFISNISQIVKMANIVNEYGELSYNLSESLSISQDLVDIFWKLKSASVSIEKIRSWMDEDIALHWWQISSFLQYSFQKFEDAIIDHSKLELKQVFKKNKNYIIIGEVFDISKFQNIAKYSVVNFFIPPLFSLGSDISKKYAEMILSSYSMKDLSIDNDLKKIQNKKSSYIEFKDILDEVNYISKILSSSNKIISVITENLILKDLLSVELQKNQIIYNSSFGDKYSSFEEVKIFLAISEIKNNSGNFESFLNLISLPCFLESGNIKNLLTNLNNSNKYFANLDDVSSFLSEDKILHSMYIILKDWILFDSEDIKEIFEKNYDIFKKIYNLLECKTNPKKSEKFAYLVKQIQNFVYDKKYDFESYNEYIKSIFSMKYIVPFNREARINILNYDDAYLVESDITIFADFNENSVLNNKSGSIWLSTKILKKLNLENNNIRFSFILYLIASKLHMSELYFTRSIFNDGVVSEVCCLINYIENLEKIENCCSKYPQEKILKKKLVIKNEDMPNILYPTNIEQLLRNPYGFFFRKILGIRKEFDIFSDVGQAEFGKIIHEFIEIITKTNSEPSKIIEDIFDKKNIPSANRNLWKDSIMVLSEKIVNLNQNVRINNGEIFCEQIGKIKIDSIPNLEIAAIADRIEIYESKIVIADFKTGSVPSFVDVASSKSPQLIIEAIILVNNGFEGILYQNQEIELVFYKLKTSDPYIEPKRKTISYEEIIEHQRGLVEFLNYYYKNEKSVFNIESMPDFWKQTYDDYQYLNRYSPL